MEFIKSSLKSVMGISSSENQLSGAEIVEKLVDRITSSTLLNDRRDACRALKALSRTYRIEVGTQGMGALKQILNTDQTDCEIIGLALDTLCNITSPTTFTEEVEKQKTKHNVGEQFTEMLIKEQSSVSLILKFLEEFDFRVRWSALKLLTNLSTNKLKTIQEIILISPMGISKLMDMLSDSREVIRNDALLLLIKLTKGNTNIQKIVAFENAFDRICDVIFQEGGVEGGIVVEDCLLLMLNLLRGNYSNQNFFKEGCYIQKLIPMLQISFEANEDNLLGWNPQKVSNIHCVIQVIRALVTPSGPAQSIASCQNIMKSCGLLKILCDILMISGVPAEILTETINTVAEVIRGNKYNQEYVANVMAPSSPSRPVIVVLLMSMVNEKQPFFLRCAVFYCFQCLLYKNETMQIQSVQTLLPQGNEVSSLTTGQLLCGGLFSSEALSNWFSAVALSYSLIDNVNQKEELLRVLLATNIGTPPVTLMQQCTVLLHQCNNTQSKIGLLMLLCRWTSYSLQAVQHFLSIESSLLHLITCLSSHDSNDDLHEMLLQSMCAFLIGICVHFNNDDHSIYTKKKMCDLIENRIGLEKYQDMISGITKNEVYSRCLKHPQLYAKYPNEVLLDHEFCRLFKILEGTVIKSVLEYHEFHQGIDQLNSICSTDLTSITQYKEIIRQQDIQIQSQRMLINRLENEKKMLENEIYKLTQEILSLEDQNKILKTAQTNILNKKSTNNGISEVDILNNELKRCKNLTVDLETQLSHSQYVISQMKNNCQEANDIFLKQQLDKKIEENEHLKKDQEDLLELLNDQDRKINLYKDKLLALGEKVDLEYNTGK